MADFARWSVAVEPGLSLQPGAFLEAYEANRKDLNAMALEESPLVEPIRALAVQGFNGTPTELFKALENACNPLPRGWPKSAGSLSKMLRRLVPNLRVIGIRLLFWREPNADRTRMVTVDKVGDLMSEPSETSESQSADAPHTYDAGTSDSTDGSDGKSQHSGINAHQQPRTDSRPASGRKPGDIPVTLRDGKFYRKDTGEEIPD